MSEQSKEATLTESLAKTPPHGMKGELQMEGFLNASNVLWMSIVVSGLFLLIMLIFGILFWRRRNKNKSMNPANIVYEPSEWAKLKQIIEAIQIPSVDNMEVNSQEVNLKWGEFTSEVSLCLRRGLEIRTGKPFAERTNDEIFRLLSHGEIKLAVLSDTELRAILMRLDQVRFGGFNMTMAEASDVLKSLKDWCDRLEKENIFEASVPTSQESAGANSLETDQKRGLNVFNP